MVSLFSHIGLGDLLLLYGAILRLAKIHGGLRIYCYFAHEVSVRSFFVNYPDIQVVPVPRGTGWYGLPDEHALRPAVDGKILRCGFYAAQGVRRDISFPELFYQQLGVAYKERWEASGPLLAAAMAVAQLDTDLDVFVHDDASRGFNIIKGIDGQKVLRPLENGASILQYVNVLRKMKKIHCMDSVFYHLVESLLGIAAELYYHRYPRLYIPGWFDYPRRYPWTVLV
jgi:hypothetical protein